MNPINYTTTIVRKDNLVDIYSKDGEEKYHLCTIDLNTEKITSHCVKHIYSRFILRLLSIMHIIFVKSLLTEDD